MRAINLILVLIIFSACPLRAQWEHIPTGTVSTLWDVYFSDKNTGCIIGNNGKILKTNDGGANWNKISMGTSYKIYAMHFINSSVGIAVGEYKNIIKTEDGGETWKKKVSTSSDWLYDVYLSGDTGYAVGYNGAVWKSDDAGGWGWNEIETGDSLTSYNSVYFMDGSNGFIAGDKGTIIKTSDGGNNWTKLNTPTTQKLRKIYFKNNTLGFAIGDSGTILRTDDGGENWSLKNSWAKSTLMDIHFLSSDTGYIVGDKGLILFTSNSGGSWQSVYSGTTSLLTSVYFVSSDAGYIVGSEGTCLKINNPGTFLSLDESVDANKTILIYPNPVKNELTINIKNAHQAGMAKITVTLYDIYGKSLFMDKLEHDQFGTISKIYNLQHLASGIYYLNISEADKIFAKKILKF
ncbi:MAG: T9SS type A sorting domain-containing protein [Bacteroidia bacterium]|nr:T9SS type A sorting domain-containing protein [Bacteroidia bacterium]